MAAKRQRLQLADTYDIVRSMENGVSREEVMIKYGLKHSSNVTEIMKRKEKIISEMLKGIRSKTKTVRTSLYPKIDNDLRDFVADMNERGGAVSKSILKEKAIQLAIMHGVAGKFKASDGYLDKFMKRQSIMMNKSHGEAANVVQSVVDEWKQSLPQLISSFSPDDIFNCDELGLFFKLTPSRSYSIKGKSFRTGKHSKERVTLLLCANMSATEKLPPLLIGKSENPRCFKGIKRKPVRYRFNRKAWMTSVLFEEWLNTVNAQMREKKRKIVLFLDNCPAHPMHVPLSNITLCPLPANTTSVLQPMDQGIIKCFKCYYRKQLVRYVVNELHVNKEITIEKIKVDLLMASKWIRTAWANVTAETIRNCFRKAEFRFDTCEQEGEEEMPSLDEIELGSLQMDDFVSADDEVCVAGTVAENRMAGEEEDEDDTEEEDSLEEDEVVLVQPSARDAMLAIKSIQSFMLFKSNPDFDKQLDSIEDFVHKCARESMVQKKITDYLQTSVANV